MAKRKTGAATKPPLVILGTAGSRDQAPFADDTFEIWAVGTAAVYDDVKRIDRLFELHPRRYWSQQSVLERMNEFDGPITMQDHYEEIPNSEPYPYQEVRDKFYLPAMGDNLFVTNTITWMLLMALHEGYTDVSLFGVHMAHDSEYTYQHASLAWAIGMVQGWMIQGLPYSLYLADESEVLKARYEYGFGEPTKWMGYLNKRVNGLSEGVKQAQAQITELERRKLRTEGALQEANNMKQVAAGFR